MRTVAQALHDIIQGSPELQFGFSEGLFNLTQLAKFVRPLVEARTFKEVQDASLVMALSRMSRSALRAAKRPANSSRNVKFEVENVSVRSGLSILTLSRTRDAHRAVQGIYLKLSKKDSYFTLSEGTSEITVIFERTELPLVMSALPASDKPKIKRDHIAALGVRFHPRYIEIPGLLQRIIQQITLQGINIAELASTATELVIYIAEADVRRGLDTLLRAFVEKERNL